MEERRTDWLREHMRNHIANDALHLAENVLSFRRSQNSAMNPGEAALGLVYQVAERVREADNHAAEREARAETLAKQAIEKLNIAHERIRAAESGRLAAEAEIKKLSDRVREAEKAMEQSASRVSAVEAKISAAEQRASNAETRANEADKAFKCIEEALRRILEKLFGESNRIARAA